MPRHGHVRLANVPAPSLRPGHFLVKTEAVALSPRMSPWPECRVEQHQELHRCLIVVVDVAHVNHLGKLGGILGTLDFTSRTSLHHDHSNLRSGSEFSGMVEAIGEGYSGDIKVDDAVFGVVNCANMVPPPLSFVNFSQTPSFCT